MATLALAFAFFMVSFLILLLKIKKRFQARRLFGARAADGLPASPSPLPNA